MLSSTSSSINIVNIDINILDIVPQQSICILHITYGIWWTIFLLNYLMVLIPKIVYKLIINFHNFIHVIIFLEKYFWKEVCEVFVILSVC